MAFVATRWNWKPVYVLLGAALFLGIVLGDNPNKSHELVLEGFWAMMQSIALIVLFGALLGTLLKSAGTMDVLANRLYSGAMRRHPTLASAFVGLVVGIPVFCDAGYVVLSHLHRGSLYGKKTKIAMALLLALGLYLAHTLVPPTPGPMVVLASFDAMHLLVDLLWMGFLLALCVLLISFKLLPKWMPTVAAQQIESLIKDSNACPDEATASSTSRSAATKGIIALLLPVVLISLGTMARAAPLDFPQWMLSISKPWVALALACVFTLWVNSSVPIVKLKYSFVDTLRQVWPILLLTGAGGAFGNVIASLNLAAQLPFKFETLAAQPFILLLLAYLSTLFLKSAQGSSTAAIVVAASIIAPALGGMDLSDSLTLAIMLSIGTGALAVSHANDSFFWVIVRFEKWNNKEGLERWSVLTAFASLTGFLLLCAGYFILG